MSNQLSKQMVEFVHSTPGSKGAMSTAHCAFIPEYVYDLGFIQSLYNVVGGEHMHSAECVGIFKKREHEYSTMPVYYAEVIDISSIFALNEQLVALVPYGDIQHTGGQPMTRHEVERYQKACRSKRKLLSLILFHSFMDYARKNSQEIDTRFEKGAVVTHETSQEFSVGDGILILSTDQNFLNCLV